MREQGEVLQGCRTMCGVGRAGQHLLSRHMTSALSTLLSAAVMAAHRQLAVCYPYPFLADIRTWHRTSGQNLLKRDDLVWTSDWPSSPHTFCFPVAFSICLGFQHLVLRWIISLLYKVVVISGKYFFVVHMNGPLYLRPLNCINVWFNEIIKNC